MWSAKRPILILMLICAGFVPVCSAGTVRTRGKSKNPTASELLDKYAETQDRFQSFRVKITTLRRGFSSGIMAGKPWCSV